MQASENCLGYDSRWIGQHGIGRFAAEINNRLVFDYHFNAESSPTDVFSSYYLGKWLKQSGAKALYSPGYIPPSGTNLPFSFTIHDLNHLDVPHNSSVLKKIYYKIVILPAIERASSILTVSEFSKKRIIEWSNCDERKVHVVGNGVSDTFYSEAPPMLPGYSYFFCCSNRKGHKNEQRLLLAFAHSKLGKDIKLVLTGNIDEKTHKAIVKYKLKNQVIFTGKVSEIELSAWYKGAIATVFPTLYEGFGLPIIESMACGTPVIASNTTSLPEVGGKSAHYFDPYSIESISTAMCKMASDSELRSTMRESGFHQAKKYSWDNTAELVKQAIAGMI